MQASASAQEFMQQLPKFDEDMLKKQQDAENAGEVSDIKCINYLTVYLCALCG